LSPPTGSAQRVRAIAGEGVARIYVEPDIGARESVAQAASGTA
jgi:hypothetical protein